LLFQASKMIKVAHRKPFIFQQRDSWTSKNLIVRPPKGRTDALWILDTYLWRVTRPLKNLIIRPPKSRTEALLIPPRSRVSCFHWDTVRYYGDLKNRFLNRLKVTWLTVSAQSDFLWPKNPIHCTSWNPRLNVHGFFLAFLFIPLTEKFLKGHETIQP
jgi:hypothetical protein